MTLPITVVIPCRNDAATLSRAIQSAIAADAGEILVANDSSSDRTIQEAMHFAGTVVRLVNSPISVRTGVCFMRNYAIHYARYGLVVPLDADDALRPGGLHALYEAYAPGTFVYGGWEEAGEPHRAPPISRIAEKNVAHATWLYARDDWQRAGGYNPLFEPGCEDWAFMAALVRAGLRATCVQEAIYVKHPRPTGRAAACKARAELLIDLLEQEYPEIFDASPSRPIPTAAAAPP